MELLKKEIEKYQRVLKITENELEIMELLGEQQHRIDSKKDLIKHCNDKIENYENKLIELEGVEELSSIKMDKEFIIDYIKDLNIKEAMIKIDPITKERSLVIKFEGDSDEQ